MLLKLYEELDPQYIAVAFDKDKHTFRNDLFDGYKATRKPAPDELRPQFSLIREVLSCLGIHVLEMEGYEGDDIIGTVAKGVEKDNLDVHIVTGDRDALQLVDDAITVELTKKGITNMLAVTPEVMKDEYGYTPSQVIDMKALMGDTADNIPGVPGVGEKTALKLLSQYDTVEGVYDHLDDVKGKLKEKLYDNRELAMLSKNWRLLRRMSPLRIAWNNSSHSRGMKKSFHYSSVWDLKSSWKSCRLLTDFLRLQRSHHKKSRLLSMSRQKILHLLI